MLDFRHRLAGSRLSLRVFFLASKSRWAHPTLRFNYDFNSVSAQNARNVSQKLHDIVEYTFNISPIRRRFGPRNLLAMCLYWTQRTEFRARVLLDSRHWNVNFTTE